MTKPSIEDLRDALARMVKGEHRLHIPVQDTDEDLMLLTAINELERLRRLETVAKATYDAFKCFQYSVHMGDQTQNPDELDDYTITYSEMLRMRGALADLERWFVHKECMERGFDGCLETSVETGSCFCGRFRGGEEMNGQ